MKILVAGVGNIFMGDDGFGCEVVRELGSGTLLDEVDIVDFGVRGMDLGYALTDGYDVAILVDTVSRGGAPGTIYVIEPEIDAAANNGAAPGHDVISPHGMDPAKVLRFVASLGERRPRILLVGCEPEYLGGEEGHMGLSDTVGRAAIEAVREVQAMLAELLDDDGGSTQAERKSA